MTARLPGVSGNGLVARSGTSVGRQRERPFDDGTPAFAGSVGGSGKRSCIGARTTVRRGRVGGPSDPFVPRPELPGRGPEADPAERAVALRADPVAHLAAGRPRPSQRVVRRHHRLPEPAVVGAPHRIELDRAEILKRAGQLGAGNVPGRDGRGRCASRCARKARGPGRDGWRRRSATHRRTRQASANRNGEDRPACPKRITYTSVAL